jgi:ABC-2 type transport system permease protein
MSPCRCSSPAAQLVFGAFGMTTASFGDAATLRVVGVSTLLTPLFPLLGLTLALLVRTAAGAIAAVLALLFAPAVFGGLLPPWWQRHVIAYLPSPASDSVTSRTWTTRRRTCRSD